jgi:hypothetical protein
MIQKMRDNQVTILLVHIPQILTQFKPQRYYETLNLYIYL